MYSYFFSREVQLPKVQVNITRSSSISTCTSLLFNITFQHIFHQLSCYIIYYLVVITFQTQTFYVVIDDGAMNHGISWSMEDMRAVFVGRMRRSSQNRTAFRVWPRCNRPTNVHYGGLSPWIEMQPVNKFLAYVVVRYQNGLSHRLHVGAHVRREGFDHPERTTPADPTSYCKPSISEPHGLFTTTCVILQHVSMTSVRIKVNRSTGCATQKLCK